MRPFLICSLLLLASCSQYRLTQNIKEPDGPEWIKKALQDASDFWAEHDVGLLIGDEGLEVDVEELGPHVFGKCTSDAILMDDDIPERDRAMQVAKCVMRHETGHSLGLIHVENGESLMAPILHLTKNGCPWSADDEQDLEDTIEALGD